MNVPGLEDLMRQAQDFSQRLEKIKEELAHRTVSASAGGGMVKVEADGRGRITKVEIEPQIVEDNDVEMLQDLVCAAVNQALQNARDMAAQATRSLTGGLPIPGLDSLFS
jgi:nucleoid-associated protein EbfC